MGTLSSRLAGITGGVATLALAFTLLPEHAAAQGLTYSLVPSARWIHWDDAVDLDRTRLLGGGLNIGFGRYVGLSAFYHESGDATLLPESTLESELVQTGGEVTLALGSGTLVPILKGGASILRFRPDDPGLDDFTKLSFDYGGGLRAVLAETITGEVMVESSQYRLARERLTGGTVPLDESLRRNLSVRAGLGIQLGSRTFDRAAETDRALSSTYDSPLDNFAIAVEPGFSRFTFDDDLGIADIDAWGGRVGFDFGSFFGLRALYWRGTEEDELSEFSDFTAWGGEAQFNLGAGPGINPYLLGGLTHFDWDADDPGARRIDGTNAVTLGAGVDLDVSDRFRLTVAARSNILANSDVGSDLLSEVSDPDDLVYNWQFSAGLSFVFGEGSSRGERDSAAERPEPSVSTPARTEPTSAAEQATPDSTSRAVATSRTDTVEVAMPETGERRTIVLPVLEEGEIYIRFGPAGGSALGARPLAVGDTTAAISDEALRQLIRDEVSALGTAGSDPTVEQLSQQLAALEQRLQERLDRLAGAGTAPTVVTNVEEGDPRVSRESRELRPYSGIATGDDTQLLAGVATDIGPAWAGSAFNLVPQVAVGVGEGKPSILLNASLEYRFNEFAVGEKLRFTPMFSAGPTLLSQDGTNIRLSTFIGTGVALTEPSDEVGLNLFTGYQGVDFFGDGRLLVGIRLMR